ncbi:MAG: Chemotaxis protein CheA [Anaerolineales bacterium]|nr:Chemotaxis protein CheA [Anaerolineales bacterium]
MYDLSAFKELFASEAQERLQAIDVGLLALERNPEDQEALEAVFREAHTLKGISATMGYQDLAHVAHALEDLPDELRTGRQSMTQTLADTFFSGVDALKTLLADALAERPSSLDAEALVQDIESRVTSAAAAQGEASELDAEAAPDAEGTLDAETAPEVEAAPVDEAALAASSPGAGVTTDDPCEHPLRG